MQNILRCKDTSFFFNSKETAHKKRLMTTTNKNTTPPLVIRAGAGTLSFLVPEEDGTQTYHPYAVKSGMSLSANLREAFREQPFLRRRYDSATLLVASPVVLMPKEDYVDTENLNPDTMYGNVITGHKGEEKIVEEMPELECVAVFPVNRDLQMVVSDNTGSVSVRNVMIPVWKHLYNRYYQAGQHRKMFAVFHDKCMDICCFEQRRLHFANVFDATHAHDALYFLLYVWKQRGMSQEEDALYIIGKLPHEEWLLSRLNSYLKNIHFVNPQADLNRSALSMIEDMPFDMML